MKEGWRIKLLGDVLRKTETVNPAAFPEVEFDYVDVSSVSNETFEIEATQRLKGKDAPSRARRLVRAKDVLFATIRPTLKRIAVTPDYLDGQVCSTGYFVMRPNDEIDSRFLFYYLFTEPFMAAMASLQKGASYPAVTDAEVRAQTIMFPPIGKQRRIVAILDEAFEGIATAKAHAERNQRSAREWGVRESERVLGEAALTGRSAPLEALVAPGCTLSYGIVQPGEDVPNGLPVIRPVDLGGRTVSLSGLKRIDPALARSYSRTTLEGNDLLLCVRGTTGTVAVADAELAGANVTRGIVPIRFDPQQVSSRLGYFLLRSEGVQQQIRAKTYGTALMQINVGDLRQVVVAVPSMERQAQLVQRLEAIDESAEQLVGNYSRKLAALDELKQSLLHQAFSGQL